MKKSLIFLPVILGIAVYLYLDPKFGCHYCDGNMDEILSVDYQTCGITYRRDREPHPKTAKLYGVDETIAAENCRFILTDLADQHDILRENGYDIEEVDGKIKIYFETLGYDIVLLNDLVNNAFEKKPAP